MKDCSNCRRTGSTLCGVCGASSTDGENETPSMWICSEVNGMFSPCVDCRYHGKTTECPDNCDYIEALRVQDKSKDNENWKLKAQTARSELLRLEEAIKLVCSYGKQENEVTI